MYSSALKKNKECFEKFIKFSALKKNGATASANQIVQRSENLLHQPIQSCGTHQ